MTEIRSHRRTPRSRLHHWSAVGLLAGVLIGLPVGAAGAAALGALSPTQVSCPDGAPLIVAPGGSWSCGVAPTPSASPTVTPSASPSPSPTVTPTPSPTTPGTRLLNCWPKLAACGYPTQANTGVPAVALTAYAGDLNIRAGGTWQNLDVRGCINVSTTQAVILRNIRVTPANPSQGCGQGNISHQGGGSLLVEDVTSYCTQAHGHGFWVANTTARRIQTYGCENGFELNENSLVENSWIAGSEVASSGDPHGDDIQSQGGNNVIVRHNTFTGVHPKTSSIISNPTQNNGWTVEDNFLSSGSYTLYCPEQGTGWTVRNNRFSGPVHTAAERNAHNGDPHDPAFGYTDACNHAGITWSGNYRDDNGAAVDWDD
jgi:hypothetical protein